MRSKIGYIHFLNENYSEARHELEYSLELDPGNMEALKLLKKLEDLNNS